MYSVYLHIDTWERGEESEGGGGKGRGVGGRIRRCYSYPKQVSGSIMRWYFHQIRIAYLFIDIYLEEEEKKHIFI